MLLPNVRNTVKQSVVKRDDIHETTYEGRMKRKYKYAHKGWME